MATLSVNVDHVATLRQARGGLEPDPVTAAAMVELAGAEGIIVHLREDRRHIQDRDLHLIRQTVKTRLNFEMAATEEMIGLAAQVKPFMSTLVPEKRQELTTEGGLEVVRARDQVGLAVRRLHEAGIKVSLFVDAEPDQIHAAREVNADFVEIHTGHYADAATPEEAERLFQKIAAGVKLASDLDLLVNVGHGLNYVNIRRFAGQANIGDYSIGHAIMARAILVGLDTAVRDMAALVRSL